MLQIKFNSGFLDLGADQKLEFERENPMFILEDFYKEYSTPIVIKYSENNVALLGGIFFDVFTHHRLKVDVELWDKGTFDSNVTMVIDKSNPNRRNAGKGDVNGYLYAGLSRFFYNIKYRYVNTLSFGGQRVFNYTSADKYDMSNGYVQHFFNTQYLELDYIIAPIRNEIFNGTTTNSSGWMNDWIWQNLSATPTIPTTDKTNPDYYSQNETKYAVVFPRLKYILTQIFIEHGYTLDTSDLDGTDWEKIFLLSLHPVYFYYAQYRGAIQVSLTNPFVNSITIDLSDCISPELTCGTFILSILKKYGWTLIGKDDDFKIIALKNVKSLPKLDITQFVTDTAMIDFSQVARVQSFKNTFPSSEKFASGKTPTLADGLYILNPVVSNKDLPILLNFSSIYDNCLVYVYDENKYFKVGLRTIVGMTGPGIREWQPYTDNIYNYEPNGTTETIESNITTLPVYWTQNRIAPDGTLCYGYFPLCKQSKDENWGIRTLLFVGFVNESFMQTASGPYTLSMSKDGIEYGLTPTVGSATYPLLSSCRNNSIADILKWSNVYNHPKNGKDYGIISFWFNTWLETIGLTNLYEENIYFDKNTLRTLSFDTILTIQNIPYLLKSYTEPYPYKGFILAKMVRLIMDKSDMTSFLSTNIYLKFYWENEITTPYHGSYDSGSIITAKPIIKAYNDPYEKNLLPNVFLSVKIRIYTTDENGNYMTGGRINNTYDPGIFSSFVGIYTAKLKLINGTCNLAEMTLNSTNPFFVDDSQFRTFMYLINPILPSADGFMMERQLINHPYIPPQRQDHGYSAAVPANTTIQLQHIDLCFNQSYTIIP